MANPVIQSGGPFSGRFIEIGFPHLRLGHPQLHPEGWRVAYRDVHCLLLSADNELSLQVGREIFRIPFKADNPKNQEGLAALTAALANS